MRMFGRIGKKDQTLSEIVGIYTDLGEMFEMKTVQWALPTLRGFNMKQKLIHKKMLHLQ